MSIAAILVLAGALGLAGGSVAGAWERRASVAPLAQAAGMALLGVGGAVVLFTGETIGSSFRDSIDPAFGIDRLSGFLLATLGIVAVPAIVYRPGLPRAALSESAALVPLSGLFLASLVGVVSRPRPVTLLGFWELITLVPAVGDPRPAQ